MLFRSDSELVTDSEVMGNRGFVPPPVPPPVVEENNLISVHVFTIVVTITSVAALLFILVCIGLCCCPQHMSGYCSILEDALCYACRQKHNSGQSVLPVTILQEFQQPTRAPPIQSDHPPRYSTLPPASRLDAGTVFAATSIGPPGHIRNINKIGRAHV